MLSLCSVLHGQESSDSEVPLHEREAFDRITLDAENNNTIVEVFPLASLDRTKRVTDIPKTLKIRRLEDPPDRNYSVITKHIVRLELFPFMLLDEANRRIAKNDVDQAFPLLARLQDEYPATPGLGAATENFFVKDARFLFQQKRFDEALQSLDEVFRLNPERNRLSQMLDGVLEQILRVEFGAGNYESVRNKLDFASRRYGTVTQRTVESWSSQLEQKGLEQLRMAKEAYEQEDAAAALRLVREAIAISPEMTEIQQLRSEILSKYPRIRVAVFQPYSEEQVAVKTQLSWALRRVAPLVSREFVAFKDFTSEGGEYEFRAGKLTIAPDRRQMELVLDPKYQGTLHELSRAMLQLADPGTANFLPRWAEYLSSLYVPSPNKIEVRLTRPSLRPEGLLPRAMPSMDETVGFAPGPFQTRKTSEDILSFERREPLPGVDLNEVSEHYFADNELAVEALVTGDVDIIDRVYPGDLARLKGLTQLRTIPYRLPTIHALVFNDREPLLRSSTFRRGVLRSIDRAGFAKADLNVGGSSIAQVISGFAPAGESRNDPLGYAYDHRIVPRSFDPALGLFLARLAVAQRATLLADSESAEDQSGENAAADTDSDSPEEIAEAIADSFYAMPSLTLAYPDGVISSNASAAIASDLRAIGIEVTLRALPPNLSRPPDNDWDLLYLETTIEEPIVDLPELILGQSILGRHGGLVRQATRTLQEAATLEEVRQQFSRIHKLTYDHTPMIPLWQITEHLAMHRAVQGVPERPISLYQSLSDWRFRYSLHGAVSVGNDAVSNPDRVVVG